MSSSTEDVLCSGRISDVRKSVERANELFDGETSASIEVEKHYNHYGDRGVADLFIREREPNGVENDYVYEFKSDAAIEAATGANEIIRQFNRMCSYFYKDDEIDLPDTRAWENSAITFELCFNATPTAFEHVLDNYEIYESIAQPVVPGGLRDAGAWVTFRVDGEKAPIPATYGHESSKKYGKEDFKKIYENRAVGSGDREVSD